ncbi:DUF551 domain-containing protein [Faecalicoccus sp. LCP19S3_E3]|uniref:DUF551 domain-containing protein n=1 Tax=unclassified Faecalicoccus TaxID=2643311 RepID=UPI003F8FD4DA
MIDEKKLIESVKAYKELGLGRNLHSIADTIIEIIESQPKANEWIPVKDRLPENDECVLVSYRSIMKWDKKIYVDQIAIRREDGWNWWDGFETEVKNEIVAWQPLPETYEAKENE